ncbi:unnamed protein product [Lactuca saligna]|uniref:Uncharacterized protein n=1 Tax=Lactuca saligna TaxID=75948 RepID=A0AA35YXN4_LACSI|nr:unnamed protein product [Lactuca saligna]
MKIPKNIFDDVTGFPIVARILDSMLNLVNPSNKLLIGYQDSMDSNPIEKLVETPVKKVAKEIPTPVVKTISQEASRNRHTLDVAQKLKKRKPTLVQDQMENVLVESGHDSDDSNTKIEVSFHVSP